MFYYGLELFLQNLEFGIRTASRLRTPMAIPSITIPIGAAGFGLAVLLYTIVLIKYPDVNSENYFRIASMVDPSIFIPVSFFVLYASGFLNGNRLFKEQSWARIINSISKLFLVILSVTVGFQIYGVIGAYIIAALIAFFAAYFFFKSFKIKHIESQFSKKKIILFAIPILVFSAICRFIKNTGLLFVRMA